MDPVVITTNIDTAELAEQLFLNLYEEDLVDLIAAAESALAAVEDQKVKPE